MNEKNLKIKQYKKNKEFDKIYTEFGKESYLRNTPYRYIKEDIKNLVKKGRFLDIYEKYSEEEYNKRIKKFQKIDVKNELGVNVTFVSPVLFSNIKRKFVKVKKTILTTIIAIEAAFVSFCGMLEIGNINKIRENIQENKDLIDEYNKDIKKYAEYINSLNLSDLEIFVKVMDDMWYYIDGYKAPTNYDENGIRRLSVYSDGYGVCRNYADDIACRLNVINPKYNASTMTVYMEDAECNNSCKKIKILKDENVNENTTENTNGDEFDYTKIFGNHMVVCVELDGYKFILDPTNPSIGMLENGNIYMFNQDGKDDLYYKFYGFLSVGTNSTSKVISSFFDHGGYDELYKYYCIEEQNKALEKIEQIDRLEDNTFVKSK